jgi:hypothetical protein
MKIQKANPTKICGNRYAEIFFTALKKKTGGRVTVYVIFSFTRYPAPDRTKIKMTIAAR